jgi:hypothetical protein
MGRNIFGRDGESFPRLNHDSSTVFRLAGGSPEYLPETRLLRKGPNHLQGCRILATNALVADVAKEIASIVLNERHYDPDRNGARCYFPGFGFRFGSGDECVEILICLECSWVVFHSSSGQQSLVPNRRGISVLRHLYEQHVPHADPPA